MTEIIKRNSKYQKKRATNYRFWFEGTNSVGQPYEL